MVGYSVMKGKVHIDYNKDCPGSRETMSKYLNCWVEEFILI